MICADYLFIQLTLERVLSEVCGMSSDSPDSSPAKTTLLLAHCGAVTEGWEPKGGLWVSCLTEVFKDSISDEKKIIRLCADGGSNSTYLRTRSGSL